MRSARESEAENGKSGILSRIPPGAERNQVRDDVQRLSCFLQGPVQFERSGHLSRAQDLEIQGGTSLE